MTSAFAPESLAPERAPRPRRRAPELRPVGRPGARRSPAVPVLVGAGIVIAALFALAVMHALLIGGQLRLDGMQREVASETEEIRRLRLQVAELEAPHRVLAVARERLGMVQPAEVGYLAPAGVQTGDDDRVRVEPAEAPVEVDAEAAEVDDDTEDAADAEGTDAGTPADAAEGEGSTDEAPAADAEPAPDAPVAGGGDE